MTTRMSPCPNGGSTRSQPLPSFTRLAPNVRLYEPPKPLGISSSLSPTTILLCSWMNGAPKHIEYYAVYMRFYPAARIILVTINTTEFLFQSETRRRSDIKEAVTALLAQDPEKERLLLHAFSNGGARRVYGIAGAYQALTGKPLPAQAFIVDSAPGIPKFRRDLRALSLPLKKLNWFLCLPAMAATLLTVSALFVIVNWIPKWVWRELVCGPTEGINDVVLIDRMCVKGYVYSKEDLVIDWRNVEDHAAVAEENGYRVVKKRVEGAEHVQMFRGEGGEKAYWSFIESVWEIAVGME
jgi:hypothetical protein